MFPAQDLRESRLLLMATDRDTNLSRYYPLFEVLGELASEGQFQRLIWRGLSDEDTGRLIQMMAGFQPPQVLVERLHAQTEGNPLFLTEMIRVLNREGALSPGRVRQHLGLPLRVPAGVREVIGKRLNGFSLQCNHMLSLASVISRAFSLEELSRLG